jgi:hypothetical protein
MTDPGPEVNDIGDRDRLITDTDTVAILSHLPLGPISVSGENRYRRRT